MFNACSVVVYTFDGERNGKVKLVYVGMDAEFAFRIRFLVLCSVFNGLIL